MKPRPYIVTQTRSLETAGLYRCADKLAARMGELGAARRTAKMIRYSRLLIRVMRIIMDVTLGNNCYTARRDVLGSARLRRKVTEQLGGARALVLWRRKAAWNAARLAAVASGTYRTPARKDSASRQAALIQAAPQSASRFAANAGPMRAASSRPKAPVAAAAFKAFRLPVLQNLNYVPPVRRPASARQALQRRFPCIVVWPHELDGQYVPNFKSRASRPQAPTPGYSAPSERRAPALRPELHPPRRKLPS